MKNKTGLKPEPMFKISSKAEPALIDVAGKKLTGQSLNKCGI